MITHISPLVCLFWLRLFPSFRVHPDLALRVLRGHVLIRILRSLQALHLFDRCDRVVCRTHGLLRLRLHGHRRSLRLALDLAHGGVGSRSKRRIHLLCQKLACARPSRVRIRLHHNFGGGLRLPRRYRLLDLFFGLRRLLKGASVHLCRGVERLVQVAPLLGLCLLGPSTDQDHLVLRHLLLLYVKMVHLDQRPALILLLRLLKAVDDSVGAVASGRSLFLHRLW